MGSTPPGDHRTEIPASRSALRLRILLSVLLTGLLLEAGSFAVLSVQDRGLFSLRGAHGEQEDLASRNLLDFAGETERPLDTRYVLHPYLGYAPEQDEFSGEAAQEARPAFPSATGELQRRADDRLVVGLFGGSVAHRLGLSAGVEAMVEQIRAAPAHRDREVVVVRAALDGCKQPQQLMSLNYLLALGGELDVAINLDGFNEVVLTRAKNLPDQVHYAFPRGWRTLVYGLPDIEDTKLLGKVHFNEFRRSRAARWMRDTPLRYSFAANLAWRQLDRRMAGWSAEDRRALEERLRARSRSAVLGPVEGDATTDEQLADYLALWRNSSLQMDALCRSRDISYFHFLQPNQYVAGSKNFTAAERAAVVSETHPYREAAEAGYPRLMEEGRHLADQGIRYTDLTRIYADVAEPAYSDNCCHLSELGNVLLGRAIGEVVAGAGAVRD